MALQTNGQISFSDIAAEFGGVKPYSMSEYRALADMGVSGIPSSGTMRCSQFHGKSNQVSTQVWVSSGYNQSSWNRVNTGSAGWPIKWVWNSNSGQHYWFQYFNGPGLGLPTNWGSGWRNGYTTQWVNGSWRYTASSISWQSDNGNVTERSVNVDQLATTWVDTSSWQTQSTTAQITT